MVQSLDDAHGVQSLDSASTPRRRRRAGAGAAGRIPPHNLEAEESLLGAMMLSREALTAAVEAHIESARLLQARARRHLRRGAHAAQPGRAGRPGHGRRGAAAQRAARRARRPARRCCASRPRRPRRRTPAHYAQHRRPSSSMLRQLIETAGDIQDMALRGRRRRRRDARPRRVDDLRGRREARRRLARAAATRRSSRRWCSSSASTTATRRSSACPPASTISTSCCSVSSRRRSTMRRGPSRPGQDVARARRRAALRARRAQAGAVLLDGDGPPRAHEAPARGRGAASRRASSRPASFSEHEWPKLHQAVGRLAEAPFFIDDNPHCTVMEMRAKARRTQGALRRPRPDRRRLPAADVVDASASRAGRSRCRSCRAG